ncbi:MAG: hypothetical protein ABIK65_06630 [Candidatus Eisenbacteria bacterium]
MRFATSLLILTILLTAGFAQADDKDKLWEPPLAGGVRALDCSAAIPIACGQVVTGNNTGMPNNVSAYSCVGWTEGGGEVVYEFVVDAVCYSVSATLSGMSVDLDVFVLNGCDETQCIAYGNTIATTACLEPGTYYIVVDGYGTAQGAFTLTVSCTECECPVPPCGPSPFVCDVFDFNDSDNGVITAPCGGASVWQWGALSNPDVPSVACNDVTVTNVLGTVVNGDYGNLAGETAVLGPYSLGENCFCLELCHYYDTENRYDGGNLKISTDGGMTWTLLVPSRLYDAVGYTYQPCVPGEAVFTGHQFATTWLTDYFDVSNYVGQDVWLGFHFGSDSSVGSYAGWYIKWVKFGGDGPTSTQDKSWGGVKSLFR